MQIRVQTFRVIQMQSVKLVCADVKAVTSEMGIESASLTAKEVSRLLEECVLVGKTLTGEIHTPAKTGNLQAV